MPEKPIATWYVPHRDTGGTVFSRADSVPVDLPPGRTYAIFEMEAGEVTELGGRAVVVRAWSEDDPLTVADFFGALCQQRDAAAVATQRLEDWFAQACPKCRQMVVANAASPAKGKARDAKKRAKKVQNGRPKKSRAVRNAAG